VEYPLGCGGRLRHQCPSAIRAEPFVGTVPRAALESFTEPIAMFHQIHTYTELQQQIHDDLRIQHPEWVQPNGESPMCDSYEARLMELLHLDPFFAGKPERRPAFTTDEEKPNAIFDQQRLDVAAHRMGVLIPTKWAE